MTYLKLPWHEKYRLFLLKVLLYAYQSTNLLLVTAYANSLLYMHDASTLKFMLASVFFLPKK